jgi:hypothetical protein
MQERITSLYVAVLKNEVVCFDTNLKHFHNKLQKIAKGCRNYDYFYRQFRNSRYFEYTDAEGTIFYMQSLL